MALELSNFLSDQQLTDNTRRLDIPLSTASVPAAAASQSRVASVGLHTVLSQAADLQARQLEQSRIDNAADAATAQAKTAAVDIAVARTQEMEGRMNNAVVQRKQLETELSDLTQQRIDLQKASEQGGVFTKLVNSFKIDSVEQQRNVRLRGIYDLSKEYESALHDTQVAVAQEQLIKIAPALLKAQQTRAEQTANVNLVGATNAFTTFRTAYNEAQQAAQTNLSATVSKASDARQAESLRIQKEAAERQRRNSAAMLDSPEVMAILRLTGQQLTPENKVAAANAVNRLPADVANEWYSFGVAAGKVPEASGAQLREMGIKLGGNIPALVLGFAGDRTGLNVLTIADQKSVQLQVDRILKENIGNRSYYDTNGQVSAAGQKLALQQATALVRASPIDQRLQVLGDTIRSTPSAYNPNRWAGNAIKLNLSLATPGEIPANESRVISAIQDDPEFKKIMNSPARNLRLGEGERAVNAVEYLQQKGASQADAVAVISRLYSLSAKHEAAALNGDAIELLESRGVNYTPATRAEIDKPGVLSYLGDVNTTAARRANAGVFDINKVSDLNQLVINQRRIREAVRPTPSAEEAQAFLSRRSVAGDYAPANDAARSSYFGAGYTDAELQAIVNKGGK